MHTKLLPPQPRPCTYTVKQPGPVTLAPTVLANMAQNSVRDVGDHAYIRRGERALAGYNDNNH